MGKRHNIFGISWFTISRQVKMQLKCKKKTNMCAVYREGAVTHWTCQNGLWSLVLEISHWTMLHGQVDQLKLTAIKSRHWDQPPFYTQEIANILRLSKSIKLLVKMKTVSFTLQKKPYGLLANPIQYFHSPNTNSGSILAPWDRKTSRTQSLISKKTVTKGR